MDYSLDGRSVGRVYARMCVCTRVYMCVYILFFKAIGIGTRSVRTNRFVLISHRERCVDRRHVIKSIFECLWVYVGVFECMCVYVCGGVYVCACVRLRVRVCGWR